MVWAGDRMELARAAARERYRRFRPDDARVKEYVDHVADRLRRPVIYIKETVR